MWMREVRHGLVQPEDQADHEEVHAEPDQRLHVGPQQAQQRALVARLDLLAAPAARAGSAAGRRRRARRRRTGTRAGRASRACGLEPSLRSAGAVTTAPSSAAGLERLGPLVGRGDVGQRLAVAPGQGRPLAVQPLVDLDGAAQQVWELLAVALVPRRAGAVGHRDDDRVELRDHPPLGVHRGEPGLGVPLARARGSDASDGRRWWPRRAAGRPGPSGVVGSWPRFGGFSRRTGGKASGSGEVCASAYCLRLACSCGSFVSQLGVQPLRAGEHVLEREVAQLGGGVLHREQVLDLVVEALPDDAAAVVVGRVQQRRDRAVALVEVGLPVQRVVLVGPRHVPDRGARQRDRREPRARRRGRRTRSRPT